MQLRVFFVACCLVWGGRSQLELVAGNGPTFAPVARITVTLAGCDELVCRTSQIISLISQQFPQFINPSLGQYTFTVDWISADGQVPTTRPRCVMVDFTNISQGIIHCTLNVDGVPAGSDWRAFGNLTGTGDGAGPAYRSDNTFEVAKPPADDDEIPDEVGMTGGDIAGIVIGSVFFAIFGAALFSSMASQPSAEQSERNRRRRFKPKLDRGKCENCRNEKKKKKKKADRYCADCDLNLCNPCNRMLHVDPALAFHQNDLPVQKRKTAKATAKALTIGFVKTLIIGEIADEIGDAIDEVKDAMPGSGGDGGGGGGGGDQSGAADAKEDAKQAKQAADAAKLARKSAGVAKAHGPAMAGAGASMMR